MGAARRSYTREYKLEALKLVTDQGQSYAEAAQSLGMSRATAYRHWTYARAWLRDAIGD